MLIVTFIVFGICTRVLFARYMRQVATETRERIAGEVRAEMLAEGFTSAEVDAAEKAEAKRR